MRLSRRSFHSLATIAWKIAAMQTTSSTRVHMSHTRNSMVGKLWFGRTSHQILLEFSIVFERTIVSMKWVYSLQLPKLMGMPVRGKFRQMMLR